MEQMPRTLLIHLQPYARTQELEKQADQKVESRYKEPLTTETRKEETEKLIAAVLAHNLAQARELALTISEGHRWIQAPLYKFTKPEIQAVGYYDRRGFLITERKMSDLEIRRAAQ